MAQHLGKSIGVLTLLALAFACESNAGLEVETEDEQGGESPRSFAQGTTSTDAGDVASVDLPRLERRRLESSAAGVHLTRRSMRD